MPYSVDIFKQDIKATKKALESSDFEYMNIAANRIMTNAFLLGGTQLGLAGFMIRDVNLPLIALKQSDKPNSISSAKASVQLLLSKITELISSTEENKIELWDSYFIAFKSLRAHLLDEHESDVYAAEHSEFTHEAFIALINYLQKYKDDLVNRNNHLIKGTFLEINRFYQAYGITKEDLQRRAPFVLLSWIDDYVAAFSYDENEFIKQVKTIELPLVDDVLNICGREKIDLQEIVNLTWKLILKWRDLFMKHSELSRATRLAGRQEFLIEKSVETPIQIPDETKEKMANLVTKGIEEQVKGKK
ncbi:MAG: hypothetical protein ACRD38_11960 [Nitrososphaerales archaeon]